MLTPKRTRHESAVLSPTIRIGGSILLIGILLGATLQNEALYRLLGGFWQKVFASFGVPRNIPSLIQSGGAIGQITNQPRDIPAVLSYSVLYVGVCLALLYLLLSLPAQRKLVLVAYGVAVIAFLLLLVIGKLGSNAALTLSRQLIHFIVSPMPVIVLAPLLVWNSRLKHLA